MKALSRYKDQEEDIEEDPVLSAPRGPLAKETLKMAQSRMFQLETRPAGCFLGGALYLPGMFPTATARCEIHGQAAQACNLFWGVCHCVW